MSCICIFFIIFVAWYQRNYFKFVFKSIFWFLILSVVFLTVYIQFFVFALIFLFYLFLFFLDLFKQKFFNKDSEIVYKNSLIIKNIYIKFVYFFLFELPKKYAFFIFYLIIKIIYQTTNKISIIKLFNFKFLTTFLKNFFVNALLKLITSLPLFFVKNTNFLYNKTVRFFSYEKEDIYALLSNLFSNIMSDYNYIYLQIRNLKIILKDGKVYTNPRKLIHAKDLIKTIINQIKDSTKYNAGYNDIKYGSNYVLCRYNTSNPVFASRLNIDDDKTINIVSSDNNNFNWVQYHDSVNKELKLRGEPFFEKNQ